MSSTAMHWPAIPTETTAGLAARDPDFIRRTLPLAWRPLGADVDAAYDAIVDRMQAVLDRLAAERRFPILG